MAITTVVKRRVCFIACAFLWALAPALAQVPEKSVRLPARFDHDRIYVRPVTLRGDTLELYTDTGGGLFLYRQVAERFGLQLVNAGTASNPFYVTSLPEFRKGLSIPGPLTRQGRMPVYDPPAKEKETAGFTRDGILGQEWFAGRVWTFDYLRGHLYLRAPGDVPRNKSRVPLGFKTDGHGRRELNFPRIQVSIDGEILDLLFDTGATTSLSGKAMDVLGDRKSRERATSFISTAVFEKWRGRHPDWRVIESAEEETGEAMIEVPLVSVAGHDVGPVWFTRRPDKSFHEFMSRFTDKRVEGALGGNALRFFRLTVDYPNAFLVVEETRRAK